MRLPSILPANYPATGQSAYNWENGSVAFGAKEIKVRDKHKASRRKNAPKIIIE